MQKKDYQIGIVGGGAAGLMAAISAARAGCKNVAVFEGNIRCGTKILMSGGTRCNVTNQKVTPECFYGGNRNFIKNVLKAFDDKSVLRFFNSIGVNLKLESTGKYFPENDDAGTIADALLSEIKNLGVNILLSAKVESIRYESKRFILKSKEKFFTCEKIIITTGGKSYPATGSDGNGYKLAKSFGHSVIQPFPALSPIVLNEPGLTLLSGITIPAKLTLLLNGKMCSEFSDSLLITHFGISGPAVLNISREVEKHKTDDIKLKINFLPDFTAESFRILLKEQIKKRNDKLVLSFLKQYLPDKLCNYLFDISGVGQQKKFYSLSKQEIKLLTETFIEYNLNLAGVKGFQKAEVTAGGVSLDEVRYQTMESRLKQGLYFAGEILDVDGLIGGYNFQWAWSSGYAAGKAAARSLAE